MATLQPFEVIVAESKDVYRIRCVIRKKGKGEKGEIKIL